MSLRAEVDWTTLDKRKFFVNGAIVFTGLTTCLFPLTVRIDSAEHALARSHARSLSRSLARSHARATMRFARSSGHQDEDDGIGPVLDCVVADLDGRWLAPESNRSFDGSGGRSRVWLSGTLQRLFDGRLRTDPGSDDVPDGRC